MSRADHLLVTKWERLAKTFSRNHDVRVELSGDRCDTDGTTIRIPANADYFSEADQRVLEGLLDHEWLHVFEEQAAIELKKKSPATRTPLEIMKALAPREKVIFNGYEDFRIESKSAALYAGVRENLEGVLDFEMKRRLAEPEEKREPWSMMAAAIFIHAKRRSLDWMPEEYRWIVEERLDDLVQKGREAHTPEDAHAVTLETVEVLKKLLPELEEEKKGRCESDAGLDGGAGEKGTCALTDKGLDDAIAALKKFFSGEAPSSDHGVYGIAKRHIEALAREDRIVHRRWVPDPAVVALDEVKAPSVSRDARGIYLAERREMGAQIRTLKAKLFAVLRTRALDRLACDQERGMLDDSALYRLGLGEKRVFMDRIKGLPINTAVEVLIDLSGSMSAAVGRGRDRADCARLTAIVLAEAMTPLSIPFEIMGFHNTHRGPHVRGIRDDGPWSRWLPFEFLIFKGWNERLRDCQARFASISPGSQNVDGEAVMFAARRLARREETRKLLIVLSDGTPCGGGDMSQMNGHLLEVVKRVTRVGIEVLGIGMQTDEVKRFYNKRTGAKYAVVNDMNELALTVFKLFKSRLLGEVEDARASE